MPLNSVLSLKELWENTCRSFCSLQTPRKSMLWVKRNQAWSVKQRGILTNVFWCLIWGLCKAFVTRLAIHLYCGVDSKSISIEFKANWAESLLSILQFTSVWRQRSMIQYWLVLRCMSKGILSSGQYWLAMYKCAYKNWTQVWLQVAPLHGPLCNELHLIITHTRQNKADGKFAIQGHGQSCDLLFTIFYTLKSWQSILCSDTVDITIEDRYWVYVARVKRASFPQVLQRPLLLALHSIYLCIWYTHSSGPYMADTSIVH